MNNCYFLKKKISVAKISFSDSSLKFPEGVNFLLLLGASLAQMRKNKSK